jgi:hypothetical protein
MDGQHLLAVNFRKIRDKKRAMGQAYATGQHYVNHEGSTAVC